MDFTGILTQQQTYITDLLTTSVDVGDKGTELQAINTQLSNLNSKIKPETTNALLSSQAQTNQIISDEIARLKTKQDSIAQATTSQNRLIQLNQNYSQRFSQYISIVIVFVVALLLFLGILLIQQNLGIIPDGLFELLTILIAVGAIIYSLVIYNQIVNRNTMDYNKIATPPTASLTAAEIAAKTTQSANSGNLLGSIDLGACIGSSCCATGTIWDISSQACIVTKTTSGFTTLQTAYGTDILQHSKLYINTQYTSKPYEPSEFDNYAKI